MRKSYYTVISNDQASASVEHQSAPIEDERKLKPSFHSHSDAKQTTDHVQRLCNYTLGLRLAYLQLDHKVLVGHFGTIPDFIRQVESSSLLDFFNPHRSFSTRYP